MNTSKASRGLPLPSLWQVFVFVVVLCVGWLIWREIDPLVRDSISPANVSQVPRHVSEIDEVSDNPVASLHAVEVFARLGADAVPRLLAELSAADPRSRALALHGLAKIGPEAAQSLARVRDLLTDDNPQVRANAAFALWSIGQDAEEGGRVAAQMLTDPTAEVRDSAVLQLLLIGPAATHIMLEMLNHEQALARSLALRILREWKQPRIEGWPQWLDEVSGPVRRLRNDPDDRLRINSLTALVEWHIAEPEEVRELLHHDDPARIEIALAAVSHLGERAAELRPDVVGLIDRFKMESMPGQGEGDLSPQTGAYPHGIHGDLKRLLLVLQALKSMRMAARPAAPRLLLLLAARSDSTRQPILETLAAIGADRDDLVRVLAPLVLDKDRGVAYHAGRMLVVVSPEAARKEVSKLLPQLGSGANVNKSVLFALFALGPQAAEAAHQVAPLATNPDKWVSDLAKNVLNAIGPGVASGTKSKA